jgi:hypothetical protein
MGIMVESCTEAFCIHGYVVGVRNHNVCVYVNDAIKTNRMDARR